jgi:hypothetical protein
LRNPIGAKDWRRKQHKESFSEAHPKSGSRTRTRF